MKSAGYKWSIYMLLLATFPCCLVDDCPDDKMQTGEVTNHQAGDNDCGSCSPFFSCEGCAAVSATVEPLYFSLVSLPVKQVYTGFISPLVSDVHYDFWQPPRLGY